MKTGHAQGGDPMRAHHLRVLVAAVLLVFLSATTIPAAINAQARLAPTVFNCSTVTEIPFIECEALVALYNSANGAGWTNHGGWLTGTPCNWYRVTCQTEHVTGLDLSTNQLSGSIPPGLGNLANLQELDVFSNQLSGSIPPELGNLANLFYLDLGSNQLSGSIPPELGNLANLKWLYLDSNQLRGPLPQSLTNLDTLAYFYFDVGLLCVPDNATFAGWLAGIADKSTGGATCKTCYLPALMR
jgi:hypothetical protein